MNNYYPGPAQVSIFVGGIWIDDACGIEIGGISGKEAYYGYHDAEPRTFGQGRSIVTGALSINFRFSGYLTKAIYAARKGKLSGADLAIAARTTSLLKAIRNSNMLGTKGFVDSHAWGDFLSDLAVARGAAGPLHPFDSKAAFHGASRYLKDRFWGKSDVVDEKFVNDGVEGTLATETFPPPTDPTFEEKVDRVNLVVYYTSEFGEHNPELAEVIEDVHFTSLGKRIDNSRAEFGGSPIIERYEFVAKRVRPFSAR